MINAGVIGDPISHSLSPALHGYWLNALGIDGKYQAIRVEQDNLGDFISNMAKAGYAGVNVTLPHKEAALGHCDEITKTAKIIGAVNTMWLENGKIHGDNTDMAGFLAGLGNVPKTAMVLGAGGSSRAILYGLLTHGCEEIRLVNRTIDRAEKLAQEFSAYGRIKVLSYDEMNFNLPDCGLVVNCSSAGIKGDEARLPDFAKLPKNAVAYDISYKPYETAFLQGAKQAGLGLRYGIDMLIHQAVPGFCLWFKPDAKPVVDSKLRDYLVGLL